MRNASDIIVFDFETGDRDPYDPTLEVVSLGAKAINGITLQAYPADEGEFYSLMKPIDFKKLNPKAMAVNKISLDDLRKAPDREVVIREFMKFVAKYNKARFQTPIAAGKNIINFDIPILTRLLSGYKIKYPFNQRMILELEHLLYLYTNNIQELPSISMDKIRPYFGLPTDGGHNATVDCRHTALLITKFLKLSRHFEKNIKFKDSCKDVPI